VVGSSSQENVRLLNQSGGDAQTFAPSRQRAELAVACVIFAIRRRAEDFPQKQSGAFVAPARVLHGKAFPMTRANGFVGGEF